MAKKKTTVIVVKPAEWLGQTRGELMNRRVLWWAAVCGYGIAISWTRPVWLWVALCLAGGVMLMLLYPLQGEHDGEEHC